MKGHKLLALLLAFLLCAQLLPISTAYAAETSEEDVKVTTLVNDKSYGTVTTTSKLEGLKNGDTVDLIAAPNENGHEKFLQWVVYKNDSGTTKATENTDYKLTQKEGQPGHATLEVLGTANLRVMAVFQGPVVGLIPTNYQPVPAQKKAGQTTKTMISLMNGTTVQGTTVISGWNNNPDEPLTATITLDARPTDQATSSLRIEVWERVMAMGSQPKMLADGAQYKFDDNVMTKVVGESVDGTKLRYSFKESWDWTEYSFSIVDSDNKVLKPGKIVFKYPGLAAIEAENGSVKCGETTYTNGQTVNLGTGEKTIEAVPDAGYVFTGWEIGGVTLDDATANPLTFTMPSASTTIKANFAKRPELGYQLFIEGSGKVFVDGVERANGYMASVEDKTNVKFLAEPAEGYVLDHWELSSPNEDNDSNSSGNLNSVYITNAYGGKFYNVKAVFVQKETFKLRFKLMLGEKDVTQRDDFKKVCETSNSSIPYFAYTFPSDTSLDEIYSNPTSGTLISAFSSFNSGLNYLDFPVNSSDWIVIGLDQYPGYTAQDGPQFIADGFVSSNEDAVEGRTSILNSRFGGRTYIVFRMAEDTTITANIHKMAYTPVTVSADETKGAVTITPDADASTNLWWEGTQVTVQAVPAEGYRFVCWEEIESEYITEANAAQNPLNFTLGTAEAKFSPVFEAAEATDRSITKSVDPSGKATISINGSSDTVQVKEGSTVSLGIDVDEYYLFDHWSVTQNEVETSYNLVTPANQKSESATFVMPFGESGVTVKAALKDRYSELKTLVFLMTGNNGNTAGANGLAKVSLSKNGSPLTDVNCQVQKGDTIKIDVTMLNEEYALREIVVDNLVSHESIQTITDAQGTITIPDWSSWRISVRIEKKHSISLTQPTGGTISSSNTTSQPNKTITLTAVPDSGYTLKGWVVKDELDKTIPVTADKDNRNVGTFTMPQSNVTVTAEFEVTAEITPTITSVALLQGEGGSVIANGVLSDNKWTITIPDTVSAETVAQIPSGMSDLYLQIVAPAGVKVKQDGGQFEGDWSKGNIMCYMPVNEEVTFQAIAGTATKDYTIKLVYGETDKPTLSDGSAVRIDNKSATVTFTSSEAGMYFYSVVADNAAAPDIATTGSGDTASAGSNTITLTNLTEDARDIYIVVKNASDVESAPLKVDIPAYGSSTVPDTGAYSITYSGPKGGKLVPSRTKADKGDTITVTAVPDSGYQMVAGSMTYTLAVSGGTTTKITGNQFTMPEGDVTLSCQWETASATTTSGITAFTINGVSAAVNNTTNVITITLPRGTDVTKLTPVISTSGVKSLSPASGKTVDFTNSVTYTATMDDGSTKTYTVTVYVDKGSLADQFWDKLTDFYNQTPWWQYAEHQQSTKKYPKYW